jgi:hypothetical protein
MTGAVQFVDDGSLFTSRPMRKRVFTETLQIAIVARDLEAAMATDRDLGVINEVFSGMPVAEQKPDTT